MGSPSKNWSVWSQKIAKKSLSNGLINFFCNAFPLILSHFVWICVAVDVFKLLRRKDILHSYYCVIIFSKAISLSLSTFICFWFNMNYRNIQWTGVHFVDLYGWNQSISSFSVNFNILSKNFSQPHRLAIFWRNQKRFSTMQAWTLLALFILGFIML